MKQLSLRVRLLLAAGLSITVAMVAIGVSLAWIFEQHVLRQHKATAIAHINQLISRVEFGENQQTQLSHDQVDPRFMQPLSGYYWQVESLNKRILFRSRSLWDNKLSLFKALPKGGQVQHYQILGPGGQRLLVWERQAFFNPPAATQAEADIGFRFVFALDESLLEQARNAFLLDILPGLMVISLALVIASWLQVKIGLAPLETLRQGIANIRSGKSHQLDGQYPIEVLPLIDETNALLARQTKTIKHAKTWTADLAHGLKTPLTVLSADAARLRNLGNDEMADNFKQLIRTMQRRIDRELIRARIQTTSTQPRQQCNPVEVIRGVVRALQRTPRGEQLDWQLESLSDAQACIKMNADDLAELVGNLLENANHWAKSAIRLILRIQADNFLITIEEDGPGVGAKQLSLLGQRGLRLDESQSGTGLGLAIAGDIADAYNGSIGFGPSTLGGLKVRLLLPICRSSSELIKIGKPPVMLE